MNVAQHASDLPARLESVRKRMVEAAVRAGRPPGAVRLLPVTKGVPASVIAELIPLGIDTFGENRVQEAVAKAKELPAARWELVGHLQTNKARPAVALFDLIHSVDTVRVAEALDRWAEKSGAQKRVLIQVRLGEESTKRGVPPPQVDELVARVRGFKHLRLEGLMTLPPLPAGPEESRPFFRELARIGRRCNLPELSMGMSGDFEVAIEEGATVVRVGTALFGYPAERR